MKSPLRSQAQLDLMTKAAADPAYAVTRGITADIAKKLLAEHKTAGSPKLPERIGAKS